MTTRTTILLTLLCTTLLAGCSKEEVSTFDTSYKALNIWFGTTNGAVYENATYNYSYALEEGHLSFIAQISGLPTDHDRSFTLEPFGGDYDRMGETIRLENYVIPAGKINGEFNIYFNTSKLSSPDMFSDKDGNGENGKVYFRIKPNDTFSEGAEGTQVLTVILKNYIAMPEDWNEATFPYRALKLYFGEYSKVKYQFMIEHLGIVDFHVSYSASTAWDETTNVMSTAYAVYLNQKCQVALTEYNATHDSPLIDEYGIPVTF